MINKYRRNTNCKCITFLLYAKSKANMKIYNLFELGSETVFAIINSGKICSTGNQLLIFSTILFVYDNCKFQVPVFYST